MQIEFTIHNNITQYTIPDTQYTLLFPSGDFFKKVSLENKMAKYIFAYTFLTESNSKNYLKHLLIFITCHTINSLSETDGGEE
jgi:hypothetical protein